MPAGSNKNYTIRKRGAKTRQKARAGAGEGVGARPGQGWGSSGTDAEIGKGSGAWAVVRVDQRASLVEGRWPKPDGKQP